MKDGDRQAVRRHLAARRRALVAAQPRAWHAMLRAWRAPRADSAVWLLYAANYLFNTRGLQWAVDPLRLKRVLREAPAVGAARGLAGLRFVLLTHTHGDHADPLLWTRLRELDCAWVVPAALRDWFAARTAPARPRCILARPGRTIVLPGARILPFAALHNEVLADGWKSVFPATGYLVATAAGTYLFPGDTRTYRPGFLRRFAGVDAVFAHVFLGRGAALARRPPLLDDFVRFYLACRPRRIVLAHLYEFGRTPEHCWHVAHAEMLTRAFAAAAPATAVVAPGWFEETRL